MNWSEFFAMKGYAFYVWGSYGMALLIFIVEIALVAHKIAELRGLSVEEVSRATTANARRCFPRLSKVLPPP